MNVLCECNSLCTKSVSISFQEQLALFEAGYIIIVDDCPHGPEPTDTLVEKRTGYTVYKPIEELP